MFLLPARRGEGRHIEHRALWFCQNRPVQSLGPPMTATAVASAPANSPGRVLFFALTIPLSALYADRFGRRNAMIVATLLIIGFGFVFAPLLESGSDLGVLAFLALGLGAVSYTHLTLPTTERV